MGLQDVQMKISYRSKGEDNVLETFIIPAFKESVRYKRSVGFFSSSVFELTAEGVQEFVKNGGEMQLICSPELSDEDAEAIRLGYQIKEAMLHDLFIADLENTLENLPDSNLIFLADLIKKNILNIKIVDVNDDFGIYHDKVGIFIDSSGQKVLFVGSPNESKNAYKNNYEKIRLSMSWKDGDLDRIEDDESEFDSIWEGPNPYLVRKDVTELVGSKVKEKLLKRNLVNVEKKAPIVLRDYQEKAINSWIKNGKNGFYIMATGTGKTWTAIYTAK